MMSNLRFANVDFTDVVESSWVVMLLDAYASDPMGGGRPLSEHVKANLPEAMLSTPGAFSIVAIQDETPVALANCFTALSTFSCQPLANIHDVVVLESHRGQGIGTKLLTAVQEEAVRLGCCKLTLEVLEGNHGARQAYAKFGFESYTLDDTTGRALFLQKKL